jgi:hypothetical protein
MITKIGAALESRHFITPFVTKVISVLSPSLLMAAVFSSTAVDVHS